MACLATEEAQYMTGKPDLSTNDRRKRYNEKYPSPPNDKSECKLKPAKLGEGKEEEEGGGGGVVFIFHWNCPRL